MTPAELPMVRSHEIIDFKRCQKKWFWRWRKGYALKRKTYGALALGTWVHQALALWYTSPRGGTRHDSDLGAIFSGIAESAIAWAHQDGAPESDIDAAEEHYMLGKAMLEAYQRHYVNDGLEVIAAEIPLELVIPNKAGEPIASYKLKPDGLVRLPDGGIWLIEHKTAKAIRTEHLVIDDQARPYGAMAEVLLRREGLLRKSESIKGILYNYIRKALPDERPTNAEGQSLNKNGTVSGRQPSPMFKRHPVLLSNPAKLQTLRRKRSEVLKIVSLADALRSGEVKPSSLDKTPHWSCPKTCDFFAICQLEEEGASTREMERGLYYRENPYLYDEEADSTDEPPSFEMG